jgi:hypothetical protein
MTHSSNTQNSMSINKQLILTSGFSDY